jgi:hypothetical protein
MRLLKTSRLPAFVCAVALASPVHADETAPGAAGRPDAAEAQHLSESDRLWILKSEGSTGGTALPSAIDPVLAECRAALKAHPDSLEARWRIMRALYFKGEHATADPGEKKRIFEEGKKAGEEALTILRRRAKAGGLKGADGASPVDLVPAVRNEPTAVPAFLWAAVDWGKWALVFGKTQAVKQGAAAKIRDYAKAVIALDPRYDEGAGYRILGRLHHQTPSIPFFTGWASRSEALRNLRLAVETGPRHLINRLYLAEAMWDYESSRRPEARKILEAVVAETPAPLSLVEDRKTQEEARALLQAWR